MIVTAGTPQDVDSRSLRSMANPSVKQSCAEQPAPR